MLTSYAFAAVMFFGSWQRTKMPLLAPALTHTSATSWKSPYALGVTR